VDRVDRSNRIDGVDRSSRVDRCIGETGGIQRLMVICETPNAAAARWVRPVRRRDETTVCWAGKISTSIIALIIGSMRLTVSSFEFRHKNARQG
jgi:hypothetical protein